MFQADAGGMVFIIIMSLFSYHSLRIIPHLTKATVMLVNDRPPTCYSIIAHKLRMTSIMTLHHHDKIDAAQKFGVSWGTET